MSNPLISIALNWALDRLKERSTWVGLISGLSAVGVAVKPELASIIGAAGAAVAGAVLVVSKDHKPVADAAVEAVEEVLPVVAEAFEKPKAK